jgi:hypothetical protein
MKISFFLFLLFISWPSFGNETLGEGEKQTYTTGEYLDMPETLEGIVPRIQKINANITTLDIKKSIQNFVNFKKKVFKALPLLSPITTFQPENPKYEQYMQRRGFPFILVSFLTILWGLIFLILRMVFGFCGGRASLRFGVKRSKIAIALPFLCQYGAFLLFLVFGFGYLYSAFMAATFLQDTSHQIIQSSTRQEYTVHFIYGNITEINEKEIAIPPDTLPEEKGNYSFHIGSNIELTLEEVQGNQESSERLTQFYLSYIAEGVLSAKFCFVCLLCFVFSYLVLKYKLATFSFVMGFVWLFLSAASIFLAGRYFSSLTLYIDICEETFYAAETGILPVYGSGINNYLTCLSSPAHKEINSVKFEMTHAIYAAFLVYQRRYSQLGYTQKIESTAEIVPAFETQVDNVLQDYGMVVQMLNSSIAHAERLQNCDALYEFILTNNEEICYNGLHWILRVISSLLFLYVAFTMISFGSTSASNILMSIKHRKLQEKRAEMTIRDIEH